MAADIKKVITVDSSGDFDVVNSTDIISGGYIGENITINNDYNLLENHPSINGVELVGNKTSADLKISSGGGGISIDDVYNVTNTYAGLQKNNTLTGLNTFTGINTSSYAAGKFIKYNFVDGNGTGYLAYYVTDGDGTFPTFSVGAEEGNVYVRSKLYFGSNSYLSDNTLTYYEVSTGEKKIYLSNDGIFINGTNTSDYITSSSLYNTLVSYASISQLNTKQDTLVAGEGISIVNGKNISTSIVTSGAAITKSTTSAGSVQLSVLPTFYKETGTPTRQSLEHLSANSNITGRVLFYPNTANTTTVMEMTSRTDGSTAGVNDARVLTSTTTGSSVYPLGATMETTLTTGAITLSFGDVSLATSKKFILNSTGASLNSNFTVGSSSTTYQFTVNGDYFVGGNSIFNKMSTYANLERSNNFTNTSTSYGIYINDILSPLAVYNIGTNVNYFQVNEDGITTNQVNVNGTAYLNGTSLIFTNGSNNYSITCNTNGLFYKNYEIATSNTLTNYVLKDGTKVLSDNNYTTAEKTKLSGLSNVYTDLTSKPSINSVELVGNLTSTQLGISPGVGGYASNLYPVPVASDITDYGKLMYTPDTTTSEISGASVNNTETLIKSYIFSSQIGVTTIDSGLWRFTCLAKVSNISNTTKIRIKVFKRATDGTETILTTFDSDDINSTSYVKVVAEASSTTFTTLTTDRLGFKIFVISDSTASKTVTITIGGSSSAYINTPLAIRHNQLRSPNEDPEIQHMTSAEKTKLAGLSNIPIVNVTGTTPSQGVDPNKYYIFAGPCTSLTLTLNDPSDTTRYNEYMFEFTSNSTTATTLSLPSTVKWINGTPTIEVSKTYQVSIVNNIAVIGGI
jgi:hypothetical protein